ALAGIPPESAVCIVGSGLSMADSVVTLHARGHRGPVHVVSRHGLMPLPHAQGAAADLDVQALLAMPLRRRMRALRERAHAAAALGTPWQSVMDALRPHGQALWRSLSCADQRRFLRHVVRYWDVHRHRIAPEVHARLRGMQASGQLRVHRARLDTVFPVANCVQLGARSAQGGMLQLDAHQVVNATGVEMRVQAMRNPLLQQLLGSGLAVAGPHGIGVDTDDEGCLVDADGEADPRIRVIGSLRIGRLWESLAIPELREQARDVARGLLAL
ncbi:MAG: pyridine nucleotide-disulfide oxidoreductase, partial [Gammaproteobacteria bacterium]